MCFSLPSLEERFSFYLLVNAYTFQSMLHNEMQLFAEKKLIYEVTAFVLNFQNAIIGMLLSFIIWVTHAVPT